MHRSWSFFFFNDTATTEIYTLSLHDALPICHEGDGRRAGQHGVGGGHRAGAVEGPATAGGGRDVEGTADRKSTRLNSSHANISYAVFCLKKKKITLMPRRNAAQTDSIVSF